MTAPIRDAFDCSSRKPMRRHFVSGFPRALLSLSYAQKRRTLGSRVLRSPAGIAFISFHLIISIEFNWLDNASIFLLKTCVEDLSSYQDTCINLSNNTSRKKKLCKFRVRVISFSVRSASYPVITSLLQITFMVMALKRF